MEMNLNELAKEIHSLNKEKGFWDGKRNISEALMLVISEMGEAIESHRKQCFADLKEFEYQWCKNDKRLFPYSFETLFKNYIKDTFEDEIADVATRVLDLCGYYNVDFTGHKEEENKYFSYNVGENLMDIVSLIAFCNGYVKTDQHERVKGYLKDIVFAVFAFAEHYDINLDKHIQYKLEYNRTRPRLHGKKY